MWDSVNINRNYGCNPKRLYDLGMGRLVQYCMHMILLIVTRIDCMSNQLKNDSKTTFWQIDIICFKWTAKRFISDSGNITDSNDNCHMSENYHCAWRTFEILMTFFIQILLPFIECGCRSTMTNITRPKVNYKQKWYCLPNLSIHPMQCLPIRMTRNSTA